MLLFSQRKSEERGYNYRSNTSSGSSNGSRGPMAPCPLPGCTLAISPSSLGPRSVPVSFSPSLFPFVCQLNKSQDRKGKLEVKANELKWDDAWADLSFGDNSNGKEKGKKKTFQVIGLFKHTAGNIYSSWNSTVTWNKTVFSKARETKGQFTGRHTHWGPSVCRPDQGFCFLVLLATFSPKPVGGLRGQGQTTMESLLDFSPPGIIWEGSWRVESRAVTRM